MVEKLAGTLLVVACLCVVIVALRDGIKEKNLLLIIAATCAGGALLLLLTLVWGARW